MAGVSDPLPEAPAGRLTEDRIAALRDFLEANLRLKKWAADREPRSRLRLCGPHVGLPRDLGARGAHRPHRGRARPRPGGGVGAAHRPP